MTIATPKARALALPSVLVCCLLSTGCVPEVSRKVELSATQAALKAQMEETARLERQAMEAEAAARPTEENPHEPESDTVLPAQIAVDDPAGLVDEVQEAATAPAAETVAITEEEIADTEDEVAQEVDVEVPEEPYAPAPEEEVAAPSEEQAAVEAARLVLDQAASDRATTAPDDAWAEVRRALAGDRAPATVDALLVTSSLDRIARALEQQNMLEIMEARLQDKQRSIDELRAMLLPGGMPAQGDEASDSAARSRIEAQLQALMGSQRALAAAVQAMQEARDAAEAEAQDEAAQQRAAEEEAARKAAEEEREAREQARWDALMKRLEALEAASRTAPASPAGATGGAASAAASPAGDGAKGAAKGADRTAAGDTRTRTEDPRVAELQARLQALEAAQTQRQQALDAEAQDQNLRHLQEREEAVAAMEARFAALAEMQAKALEELEKERREQRRWWQFWRQKQSEGASNESPPPTIDFEAEAARIREENQRQWEELLARQEAEQAALQQERAEAEKQRAALEAKVAELTARLEAAEQSGAAVDPAELARLDELAASVEELTARTEQLTARASELEARTIAKQERIRARLQPIIDAGLKVTITDDRARIHLPGDVLFASGSATLGEAGKATIDSIANVLKSAPGLRLQVEGHTDNVPIAGGGRTNWDLGFARARAVLDRLIADGIPPESVSAASFGDTRPVASNDTPEGRALNRRIELVVLLDE